MSRLTAVGIINVILLSSVIGVTANHLDFIGRVVAYVRSFQMPEMASNSSDTLIPTRCDESTLKHIDSRLSSLGASFERCEQKLDRCDDRVSRLITAVEKLTKGEEAVASVTTVLDLTREQRDDANVKLEESQRALIKQKDETAAEKAINEKRVRTHYSLVLLLIAASFDSALSLGFTRIAVPILSVTVLLPNELFDTLRDSFYWDIVCASVASAAFLLVLVPTIFEKAQRRARECGPGASNSTPPLTANDIHKLMSDFFHTKVRFFKRWGSPASEKTLDARRPEPASLGLLSAPLVISNGKSIAAATDVPVTPMSQDILSGNKGYTEYLPADCKGCISESSSDEDSDQDDGVNLSLTGGPKA